MMRIKEVNYINAAKIKKKISNEHSAEEYSLFKQRLDHMEASLLE